MKIIDNRKDKVLKPKDMITGDIYGITWIYDTGYNTVIKVDNDACENDYIAFVDLFDGTYFEVRENEIASIEKLNGKLVID